MIPFDNIWLLHPAAVHFPIAFLFLGLAVGALRVFLPPRVYERRAGVESALALSSRWLLWLGTAAAWAALGLGLIAEDTVPHVPAAWHMLHDHEAAAWWTVGFFTALSLLRFWFDRQKPTKKLEIAFLAAWLMAASVIARTAWLGGELVFTYNVGTQATR